MSEFITYRFPGKEVVSKTGFFKKLTEEETPSGFIISTFDMDEVFQFVEKEETNTEFHAKEQTPYVMSPREYYLQAHELLNGMNVMQMEKAVFSRIKQVKFDIQNSSTLFEKLAEKYPKAFVYLISSQNFGTWIGASPEILVEAHKDFIFTTSLAGTKKQNENREWLEKEIHEQKIVTDYVLETLNHLNLNLIESEGPYDYEAGPVTHLRTDISANISSKHPWEIAKTIHPSPAVSGFPKQQSIDLIHSIEPHKRELYTGIIGLVSNESCKLYVNLRCAQIQKNNLFLYLGGGYTLESIPELEWIETENKSKTILSCL